MAAQLPQSVEAFGQVPGVGPVKVEKYADVFLPIICDYCQKHGRNFYVQRQEKLDSGSSVRI